MRLSISTLGLLACSIGTALAQRGDTTTTTSQAAVATNYLEIEPLDESASPSAEVIILKMGDQTVRWTSTETTLKVTKVQLIRAEDKEVVGSGTPPGFSAEVGGSGSGSRDTDVDVITLQVDSLSQMTITTTTSFSTWAHLVRQTLYLKVDWQFGSIQGSTYSYPFGIAESPSEVAAIAATINGLVEDPTAPFQEQSTTSMGAQVPQPSTATTGATTVGGSITTAPTSGTAPTEAAQSSNSGLSTGAIAGIAVGCGVVGLAVIAGLVWFFCFRRRKQREQGHPVGYESDTGAHVMMTDKEVPGVSESSPHSAYGDDGGRLHDRGSTTIDSPYVPYSDRSPTPNHATAVAATSQSNLPAQTGSTRSPTPPISTRYAHLVEEGMTEAEISRLEEEERALDQAIEEAGSRRSHR